MAAFSKLVLLLSAVWAVAALTVQATIARGGRRDFSVPAGSGTRGVVYGFTAAMLPGKKESISRHPASFTAGVLLHVGVFASFLTVAASALLPAALPVLRTPLLAIVSLGLAACVALLIRRLISEDLREMSPPDDYFANLVIAVFLSATLAFLVDALGGSVLWILAAILLLYLPLGKLRHMVFFFLARGDLGNRLGLRGVYPPAREGVSVEKR